MRWQTAVTADLKSNQLLLFAFAQQIQTNDHLSFTLERNGLESETTARINSYNYVRSGLPFRDDSST